MEGGPKQFTTPEDEINFLREQLAVKEREVLDRVPNVDREERVSIAKENLKEYSQFTPKVILDPKYELDAHEVEASAAGLETAHDPVEEILQLAQEKGIKNALTVLEKTKNAYIVDEVHRKLIEQLHSGVQVADMEEGVPPWHMLHMTLYEVSLPAHAEEGDIALKDLIRNMQQLFAGLSIIGSAKVANHFAIEVAVANESDNIVFYMAVPDEYKTLLEKQVHSLYPQAVLTEQVHDYNVYVDQGTTIVANVSLKKFFGYPIQGLEDFSSDPLAVILNAFSKMAHEGEGAAIQYIVHHSGHEHRKRIEKIIKKVEKGDSIQEAIHSTTLMGSVGDTLQELFGSKKSASAAEKKIDQEGLELLRQKIDSELVEVNIRLVVSANDAARAKQMMQEIQATFSQFDAPDGNELKINIKSGKSQLAAQKAFSFRQFIPSQALELSVAELATLIHLPGNGINSTPQFKQSNSHVAPAPSDLPTEGTLLGKNAYRNTERDIYISEADRGRHFYIIGQTGTGKSVFMQNLVVQDIKNGYGVCMMDPHGSDIEDILGAIPPERHDDVIYFDPSNLERSIGLNMLEYDVNKPEQKTFIVGELLSIFQKLYGANPESMGPMFEQYFRNATMLVMEDPDSGNTLMDIGRVMADASFRRKKLAKATNPTVVQFWKEIAAKSGGEASLENIVPYIVSKIDPLTANDYIRPIIGQQQSTFNFRQIMDERKILLVNLSKGRLGEVNANLIGMIFVGKILMAALSRVDDPTKSFPPFYLHIDEFQNVSTPAIASILSEARKYKLGLVMAHQFIEQLDPTIKDAVFGNVGSMSVFRVGSEDAQYLQNHLQPVFDANDIMNIPNYQAYMRILANGVPTQPFSVNTEPPPESDRAIVEQLKISSMAKYGRPRDEVEAEIQARYKRPAPGVPPAPPTA